jgi:hypothetical protein
MSTQTQLEFVRAIFDQAASARAYNYAKKYVKYIPKHGETSKKEAIFWQQQAAFKSARALESLSFLLAN